MTDYGQFYDKDDDVETKSKKTRCSIKDSNVVDIIKYAKELNKLRAKAAELGICLDELEAVAKELA